MPLTGLQPSAPANCTFARPQSALPVNNCIILLAQQHAAISAASILDQPKPLLHTAARKGSWCVQYLALMLYIYLYRIRIPAVPCYTYANTPKFSGTDMANARTVQSLCATDDLHCTPWALCRNFSTLIKQTHKPGQSHITLAPRVQCNCRKTSITYAGINLQTAMGGMLPQ
jgi:hypothetical protein